MKLYCIDIQRITYMSYNIFQISDEEYSETLSLINMSATYSVTMQS